MMKIAHLNKTYDIHRSNSNQVLKDVSLTLPETGFVCILGPSGCGKTSLLNAIGGLDRFDSGTIELAGQRFARYGESGFEKVRNHSFGYIFQNYYLLQNHSVAYNVYLGLHSLKLTHREKLARVREALAAVDMERFLRRKVSTLSGGQQQRVAIARALARQPRVILADEPTGNLDEANTVNICSLLRRISRNSLVIMVTHEERIAQFFADRIITLEGGKICSDSEDWQRGNLSVDHSNTLYAGDYAEEEAALDGVHLRILQEAGAEPVNLTLVALKDRIIIKLDDGRNVVCSKVEEIPILREGTRPEISLKTLEQSETIGDFSDRENVPAKAGSGLRFDMMLSEAVALLKGKGMRGFGTWFFMAVLTVLTLLTVGDYLTVSAVDPHDFIRTDSHILEIQVERGKNLEAISLTLTDMIQEYVAHYAQAGAEFVIVPHVSSTPKISAEVYMQLDEQSISLAKFSYVPLDFFREDTLVMGRMPENTREVVVDRWVLDAALREDGILQNSIADVSFFLNQTITFPKLDYTATIVGISDCGEASMFMELSALASIGVSGTGVVTLSQLQQLYPGEFDGITLGEGECLYLERENNRQKIPGQIISMNRRRNYTIQQVIVKDCYGSVVVADGEIPAIILEMLTSRFYLYCADKEAVLEVLRQSLPESLDGMLQVKIIDAYGEAWNSYNRASHLRADARTVLTVTVIVLAMVMLYLLRRSQVHQRIELLSVYRLLGIPKRKLSGILLLEGMLIFLYSSFPTAAVTWLVVTVLSAVEDLGFSMVLPGRAAVLVSLGILGYYLAVSLLPLWRLLRLPPAQLAAKYDF